MAFSKRLMNITGAALASIAFLLLSSVSHVSAVSMQTHEMSGMNHATAKSASCVSLCMSFPVELEQKVNQGIDEEDDEPFPFGSDIPQTVKDSEDQGLPDNSLAWPLLKVPLHVLYEVYRN